jgi:hypothetical protein
MRPESPLGHTAYLSFQQLPHKSVKIIPCIHQKLQLAIDPPARTPSNGRLSRRITAGRRSSSGYGRPPLGGGHAQRAQDAGCCAVCGQPVLFSTSTVDLLLSLAASAVAARARRRRLPRPWRAQQAGRSGRCAAGSSDCVRSRLARPLFLPVRRTRARGRGGEGGTTIAFPGSILGDARRPLSAPCRAQWAVRSGRCAKTLFVCSRDTVCLLPS